jgi:hypothetical protein
LANGSLRGLQLRPGRSNRCSHLIAGDIGVDARLAKLIPSSGAPWRSPTALIDRHSNLRADGRAGHW